MCYLLTPKIGKTLVAKAVSTECGLPFLSIKGPELLGSYVGESEANVRAIFERAREAAARNQPKACILFFDELDSLAPRRGGVGDGGGVMERVVATLLAELDASTISRGAGTVFCMGATNRPDLLDPSLLRPGRLDRLVYLGIPNGNKERAQVLTAQIRKLRLEGSALEMAQQVLSTLPPSLTGADMSTIASGALLKAVQRLCRKADEEVLMVCDGNGKVVTVDQVLENWKEIELEPIVTLQDLLAASQEVHPSVSENEIDRYEKLEREFSGIV